MTRECSIGVGGGSGQLFVHGSYEAVKRVQGMIFELERLRRASGMEARRVETNKDSAPSSDDSPTAEGGDAQNPPSGNHP